MLPAKINSKPTDPSKLRRLAEGIAQGLREPAELAEVMGVGSRTLPALMRNPEFVALIDDLRDKWESLGNTPNRTQAKVDLLYETSLDRLYTLIHSTEVNPAVQVDAIKLLDKASKMNADKLAAQGTGGGGVGGFTLTINVGGQEKLVVADQPAQQ